MIVSPARAGRPGKSTRRYRPGTRRAREGLVGIRPLHPAGPALGVVLPTRLNERVLARRLEGAEPPLRVLLGRGGPGVALGARGAGGLSRRGGPGPERRPVGRWGRVRGMFLLAHRVLLRPWAGRPMGDSGAIPVPPAGPPPSAAVR